MRLLLLLLLLTACGTTASSTRTPVEVTLLNNTDHKEVVHLVVAERGKAPDGPRKELYRKPVIVAPYTEHPPQVLATVPLGDYTEVCGEPRAYPGGAACRVYRQTTNLQCNVALVPTKREPEIALTCR